MTMMYKKMCSQLAARECRTVAGPSAGCWSSPAAAASLFLRAVLATAAIPGAAAAVPCSASAAALCIHKAFMDAGSLGMSAAATRAD